MAAPNSLSFGGDPATLFAKAKYMKRTLITITVSILVTLLIVGTILEIQAQRAQLAADEQQEVYSEILDEERPLLIHLPRSYSSDPSRTYPVIYVLDAGSQDFRLAQIAGILATAESMPEVIVVGIRNTDRNRDLTPPSIYQSEDQEKKGQADLFLTFAQEELVPFIEQNYLTNGVKALAGHSRGGLFVGYALLASPDFFDAHICFSPAYWRDDHQIVRDAQAMLSGQDSLATFWYNSLGTEENDKMKAGYRAMEEQLEASLGSSMVQFWMTPGAVHGDNSYYSAPQALSQWAEYEGW